MHELTPEKLSEISSQMLNMLPGSTPSGGSAWMSPSAANPTHDNPLTGPNRVPGASQMHPPKDHSPSPLISPHHGARSTNMVDPAPHLSESLFAAAQRVAARQHHGSHRPDTSAAHNPTEIYNVSGAHNFTNLHNVTRLYHATETRDQSGRHSNPEAAGGLQNFVRGVQTSHLNAYGLENSRNTAAGSSRIFNGKSPIHQSGRPFNVQAIRRDFPILHQRVHGRPLVWMDNAATTQKPQCVIDELARFYSQDNSNIHRAAHSLAARATDAYEGARHKVQRFLGAGSPEEIIFVRGTTEGINLIAQTCGRKFLKSGDEIVLTLLEHHANIVPWQMVAKETGAIIRVVPVNDSGEILMEEYQRLLGPRTRLVGFPHANNSLGTLLPVEEMTRIAKRYGARVLIDGAQSVAHIPVNVQQLGCDFYVFSGHKIFGPSGIGAVYVKGELLEMMPPWQGGGSMIKDVTFEETVYSDPPAKFEAGTPNIADAVGLGAALDYVTQLGLSQVARHEHQLLEYATEKISQIDGIRLIGTARDKVSVLSLVMQNRPTEEIGRLLDQEGIAVRSGHHCAQPSLRRFGLETTVRPSLSIYNTYDEIDHLADTLKRIRHRSPRVAKHF